jgi:hypothetical protein
MDSATDRRVQELRNKYPADKTATWEIRGEDPNCDLGGHHGNPRLGVMIGRYEDVLEKALSMPGFWTWGWGGKVEPLEIITLEDPDSLTEIDIPQKETESILDELRSSWLDEVRPK